METAFFNFMQKEDDKDKIYRNSLSVVVYTTLFFTALLFLFSNPIASAIKYPDKGIYVKWFALIIAFDAVTAIPFARLRQQNKPLKFALLKLANILFNIGFNLFFLVGCPQWIKGGHGVLSQLAVSCYSPAIGVGYVFLSNVFAGLITLMLLYRQFKQITFKPDWQLIGRMLHYALPLMIAGFAGMINETFDRAVYKYLAPNPHTALAELGIYSACYKLSIIMTLFIQTFRYAAEPFFFAQQNKQNKGEVYAKVMTWFVITCSFIFLSVMLFIDFIQLFIGEKFRSGMGVVPVLLMANLFLGVFYNLSMWYKLSGQTRFGAYFSLLGAAITIVLLFVLVPIAGYMGAAWATLLTYFAMMVVSYLTGQKFYPIPYKVKNDTFFIALALLFYAISWMVMQFWPAEPVVKRIINILLLLLFPLVVYRINRHEFIKPQVSETRNKIRKPDEEY